MDAEITRLKEDLTNSECSRFDALYATQRKDPNTAPCSFPSVWRIWNRQSEVLTAANTRFFRILRPIFLGEKQ